MAGRRLFTREDLDGPYVGPNPGPPETVSNQNLLILHHDASRRHEREIFNRNAWALRWAERDGRLRVRAANLVQRNLQHVQLIGSSAPTLVFLHRLTLGAIRRMHTEFQQVHALWVASIRRLRSNMRHYRRYLTDGRPVLFGYRSDNDD